MWHPLHRSFRLPATFVALRAFILDGVDPEDGVEVYQHAYHKCGGFFCGDIDATLLDPPADLADPVELAYDNQPIEIVPFGWNGGDGLHYGWAVLAPELDLPDHPCVSFAAIDGQAVWLGDDTKEALENLLVGRVAGWARWQRRQGLPSPADDPRWATLCSRLDLHPRLGSAEITPGARSNRAIRPTVPPAWRYEPTDDGVGVLAPASAFAPTEMEIDPAWDTDEHIEQARGHLAAGHAASALCVLKATYPDRETMQTMREAYQALGRTLHVERVDAWLRQHP